MQQYIAEDILKGMDVKSLVNVQLVSQLWKDVVVNRQLWRKLIERYVSGSHIIKLKECMHLLMYYYYWLL